MNHTEFLQAAFEGRWSTILFQLPEWPELDESWYTRPSVAHGTASGIIVINEE